MNNETEPASINVEESSDKEEVKSSNAGGRPDVTRSPKSAPSRVPASSRRAEPAVNQRQNNPRSAQNRSQDGIRTANSARVTASTQQTLAVQLRSLFEKERLPPENAEEARALFDQLVRTCEQNLNFYYSPVREYNPVYEIANAVLQGEALMHADFRQLDQIIANSTPLKAIPLLIPETGREWLVQNWMPAGRLGIMTGIGGVGKSKMALQLAYALCTDTPWLGESSCMPAMNSTGPVVYASYEDESDEIVRRLYVVHAYRDLELREKSSIESEGSGEVQRINFGDVPFFGYVMRGQGQLWSPSSDSGHILSTAGITRTGLRLREACEVAGAKLLVIDNIAGAYGSDMNALPLVRAFLADWDKWGEDNGCAVLLIMHPPKQASEISGSMDWFNGARYVWSMDTVKKSSEKDKVAVRLNMLKNNYEDLQPSIWLQYKSNFWVEAGAITQRNTPHYSKR